MSAMEEFIIDFVSKNPNCGTDDIIAAYEKVALRSFTKRNFLRFFALIVDLVNNRVLKDVHQEEETGRYVLTVNG